MLIDRSYFVGELQIVANQEAQIERLNWFIEKHEPEFLQKLLGYDLFYQFMNALVVSPVAEEWISLLSGAEYVDVYGRVKRWRGLIEDESTSLKLSLVNTKTVIVGRGQQYDPQPASVTTAIPSDLLGKDFIFSQALFGELTEGIDYEIVGNNITLLQSHIFSSGDKYFFRPSSFSFRSQTGNFKRSMIANYVYYWYMRDLVTQTSAVGEVGTKTENSVRADASMKMVTAWNSLCRMVREYREYSGRVNVNVWVMQSGFYRGLKSNVDEFTEINTYGI